MESAIQTLSGGGEIKNLPAIHGDVSKCAAQYVRMSTEHQKYSTENQSAAISEYAHRHGLTIVRSYADKGRSGLNLDGRPALQQLLADIGVGSTPFKVILVFDVSRWGRFQDTDESAYYEFMCRHAGFEIRYCAEPFENDGSMFAGLVKSIKRLMAAEYSRELSAKVFVAKCRLAALGFRQGSTPGYGLRRLVIDENRRPKFVLAPGERKAIHTDRILLVPGPCKEVQIVRDIFKLFVSKKKNQAQIARFLNEKGIPGEKGRAWRRQHVHEVLTNEKYIGNNIYNKHSFKLRIAHIENPPSVWVRADGSFAPIIDKSTFDAARRLMGVRFKALSDAEALARLRSCLKRHGRLTTAIINADKGTPCVTTYENKFGSLRRAYQLIEYPISERRIGFWELLRETFPRRKSLLDAAIEVVTKSGGEVQRKAGIGTFSVDRCLLISISVVHMRKTRTRRVGWDLGVRNANADVFVAARTDSDRSTILDYYLLPRSVIKKKTSIRLASIKRIYLEEYRHTSLDALPDLIRKVKSETKANAAIAFHKR